MDDLDTRDLAQSVRGALRRRILALPEEAVASDYVAVMAQVRALRALIRRLHAVEHQLEAGDDPVLAAEYRQLTEAVGLITREMGR